MKKFLSLCGIGVLVVCVGGCSLVGMLQRKITQGSIAGGNSWYIEKIVLAEGEFKAPQILAKESAQKLLSLDGAINLDDAQKSQAKQDMQQDDDEVDESVDSSTSTQESKIDENNIENLKNLAKIDEIATLEFNNTDGRISGSSGCGSYFARFSWDDKHTITIIPGGSTRKLCTPNEVMRFEFRFVRALDGNFTIIQDNDKSLILQSKDLTIYLYRDEGIQSNNKES